jgi:sulfate transport system permease protein
MAFFRSHRRVLPGLSLTLGTTLLFLGLIVLLPLSALLIKTNELSWDELIRVVTSPRAVAAYVVTLRAALMATVFNLFYGLLMAWILVRYRFSGRRLLDAMMDLPFALPTAVAGIALTALLAKNGWVGSLVAPFGITIAYTELGIAVAMAFVSFPFVVRTVQPVLEEFDFELEEAARTLGAREWQIFLRVILPHIAPGLLAGCALAFSRCLGEFGAVIFIAGNMPLKTEIAALLVFIRLEEFDYPAASAIACVILLSSFVLLLVINMLQAWQLRYQVRSS